MTVFQKKLWFGLLIMAILTPIGIIIPERFNAGDAWGEWDAGTIEKLLGYVPEGLKRLADIWRSPIPDYNLGGEEASFALQAISCIISAALGISAAVLIIYMISRFLIKHEG